MICYDGQALKTEARILKVSVLKFNAAYSLTWNLFEILNRC